ncbi:MAG: circadian clock protein KaiC [Acidobacteriota bacterium]
MRGPRGIEKSATGIPGLDEITDGGFPRGRPTLVCGSAGCGKTLMAMEFLIRGATEFGEPGVFMAFEETATELAENVRSLGFDLDELIRRKKIVVDYVHIEASEVEESGEYDLEGLFIRLGQAIDSIGAKRVVLDTIEVLFGALPNVMVLRSELRRLFRWLKARRVTAVVTGERGDGTLTRQGMEEYVSDCVILLDHRVNDQVSTRRLRIVKYRGTTHGTNEYPFLIDEAGISVLPITAGTLRHAVSDERISSGVPALDSMLAGKGYHRGSSILISGTAGTGKTSLAAQFADATCRRRERCLYFAFEEAESQFLRNMRSIGVDLGPHVRKGLLRFHASRPTLYGLETHLSIMHRAIHSFKPSVVIIDPISNFSSGGTRSESTAMLTRLLDQLKSTQTTVLMTNLTSGAGSLENTEVGISSLVDSWLLLRDIELNGERNRGMYVLKARGTAHSNQIREFLLTDHGIELQDAYIGPGGVLTGSSRIAQEAREQAEARARGEEADSKRRALERRQQALDAQIAGLRAEFEAEQEDLKRSLQQQASNEERGRDVQRKMATSRKVGRQAGGRKRDTESEAR